MKRVIATLILACMSTAAFGVELVQDRAYQEYFVDFEDKHEVALHVFGEEYRAAQPRTLVMIKKVDDNLYVVNQENLYYPMIARFPAPKPVPQRDEALLTIKKPINYGMVRVLVPASLNATVIDLNKPVIPFDPTEPEPICMAYWQGYVYDSGVNECLRLGASGCSNPFEFKTVEACEAANGL